MVASADETKLRSGMGSSFPGVFQWDKLALTVYPRIPTLC